MCVWIWIVYLGLLSRHPRCLLALLPVIPPSALLSRCLRVLFAFIASFMLSSLPSVVSAISSLPSLFFRSHGFVPAIGTLISLSELCFLSYCLVFALVTCSTLPAFSFGSLGLFSFPGPDLSSFSMFSMFSLSTPYLLFRILLRLCLLCRLLCRFVFFHRLCCLYHSSFVVFVVFVIRRSSPHSFVDCFRFYRRLYSRLVFVTADRFVICLRLRTSSSSFALFPQRFCIWIHEELSHLGFLWSFVPSASRDGIVWGYFAFWMLEFWNLDFGFLQTTALSSRDLRA
jgi:hypothetical protein